MRKFFKDILGITDLEKKISRMEMDEENRMKSRIEQAKGYYDLQHAYKLAAKEITDIRGLFSIGVDFHKSKAKSWSIVMIDGDPNFIRFVEFKKGPAQARELRDLLVKFGGSQVVVDTDPSRNKSKQEFFRSLDLQCAEEELTESKEIVRAYEEDQKNEGKI